MKSEKAKQFLEVAGHEVLYYSLRAFDEHPEVDSIVLVTKEEFVEHCQKELVERYRQQLQYYEQALAMVTGKRVRERLIYSFALGKLIPV